MLVANICLLILLNLIFLQHPFLASSWEWELTVSDHNACIFYRFMQKIYQNSQRNYVKHIGFYFTFVKYAAEMAHYRLEDNDGTEKAPFAMIDCNVNRPFYYDKTLEEQFVKEFDTEIFGRQNPSLPQEVVDQLMLLTITSAAQYILNASFEYYKAFNNSKHTAEWQLDTLMAASKKISKNHNIIEYGIYPFGIFPGRLRQISFMDISKEFIGHFKFVLELSKFSLTPYEVYEVLETILHESEYANTDDIRSIGDDVPAKQRQQMPKVYEVVNNYFIAKIDEKTNNGMFSKELLLSCALYYLGKRLNAMLSRFQYNGFFERYTVTHMKVCDDSLYELANIIPYSTEFPRSSLLQLMEHMKNYSRLITNDSTNEYEALVQFSEVLLEYAISARDTIRDRHQIVPKKLDEIKIVLRLLDNIKDNELYEKMNDLTKIFNKKVKIFVTKYWLDQLIQLLQQIIGDYGWTGTMPPLNFMKSTKENIPKFGQFLFTTLQKWSNEVKYDATEQLLTFPSAMNEHLIGRFHALLESNSNLICKIGEQLDFVSTLQNIASTAEQFEFTQRRKAISAKVNCQFYSEFFLPLTICLSIYIENANLSRQFIDTFVSAYSCLKPDISTIYFQTQTDELIKRIELKIPDWNFPFSNYIENTKQFQQKRTKQMLRFLLIVPTNSISTYHILKAAQKFGEEQADQIWIHRSDSELLHKIINYMRENNESSVETKVKSRNEFCFLAQFVKLLIEKMGTANEMPKIEKLFENDEDDEIPSLGDIVDVTIGTFILADEKLCSESKEQSETEKYFHEHLSKFVNVITIDFTPLNNLNQIVPAIVAELENMRANCVWNCANLFYLKGLEWHILKYFLGQMGAIDSKWAEIEQLRKEWAQLYAEYFKDNHSVKAREFEEVIEKLTDALRSIA